MDRYIYNGPVLNMNRIIKDKWSSETYAVSRKKAISNLSYQFKKQHGLLRTAKITLGSNPIMLLKEA